MRRYRTEVIDLPKSFPRVRVIEDYSEEHYINTFTDLSESDTTQIIPQMTHWCLENDCGYRTSYDTFKFRTNKQRMMFLLRWGK